MELVNNKYIRLDMFDLCAQQLRASENNDENREMYFNKIMITLMDYQKNKKLHVLDIYINKNNIYMKKLLENSEIKITRQTILNAIMFAILNDDTDMIKELKWFSSKKVYLPSELGKSLDYVLSHGMDTNEYLDGEEPRLIYNDIENCLEEGYVFETKQPEKNKQLKLK